MYSYKIENAVDDGFRNYILKFVDDNFNMFEVNSYGPGRFFMTHIKDGVIEQEMIKLAHKFGIYEWKPEPLYGNFIGYNFEGSFIHPHRDKSPTGYTHIRFNIMISKPEKGGEPIIDGNIVDIEENDSWMCIASKQLHQTNPVIGNKRRIVLSLGILVKNESLTFLLKGNNNESIC